MANDTSAESYWADVATLAEECADASEPTDAISEACDGSWWVIYTHASIALLAHTSNEDAAWESTDEPLAGCGSYAEVCTKLAYCALYQDVSEAIAAIIEKREADADEE